MYKINELIKMDGASFKVTEIKKEKWSFDFDQIVITVEAMVEEREYVFVKLRHVDFIRGMKNEENTSISWNFPVADPAPLLSNEVHTDTIIVYVPVGENRKVTIDIVNPVQFFNIISEVAKNTETYQIEIEI